MSIFKVYQKHSTLKKLFYPLLMTLWLGMSVALLSQNTKIIRNDLTFRMEFEALKSDTSIRNGYYRLFYKDKIIERGQYVSGKRAGLWRFYNLKGVFDYEYDFETRRVTQMSGEWDVNSETPCLFLGSPFIPYHFLRSINYPQEAYDMNLKGKVVLTLKINTEGKMWSYYLSEKTHPLLDAEVMRVMATMPKSWEWVPATRFGQPIDSEYVITIYFDGDE